jgi:hypothetical protein
LSIAAIAQHRGWLTTQVRFLILASRYTHHTGVIAQTFALLRPEDLHPARRYVDLMVQTGEMSAEETADSIDESVV